MARYRKVDPRMWGDAKFRKLTPIPPCGQGLWVYLLTCPEATSLPGVIVAGEAGLAEALGWTLEAFRKAFREALAEGLLRADTQHRIVWLPNGPKYNPPESPNVVRSWRDHWDNVPECPLKTEIYRGLRAFVEGLGEGFRKAFREACPDPEGLGSVDPSPNQEQEQEPDQDPEQDPESDRPTKRKPPGNRKTGRKTKLPDDWKPTEEHRTIAEREGVDLVRELEKFLDHCEANAWRKVDWNATFRNWLRNASEYRRGGLLPTGPRDSRADAQLRRQLERVERLKREEAKGDESTGS